MKLRILPGIFLLSILLSCTKQQVYLDETNDSSLAKIIVNKELIVGVDPSLPPLSFYSDTGRIIGYDVDIAQTIADRLGVNLRLVAVTAENRIQILENRGIDYIASGFINNEQNAKRFLLSAPYLRDALVVVVLRDAKGETPFKEFSDLRNKRIGIVSDQEVMEIAAHSPLFINNIRKPYLFPRLEKLLIALDYGQLEAGVMSLLAFYSKITKEKKPYDAVGEPLTIATYSYAFRKEDGELHDAVDLLLQDMAEQGTLKAISDKWFGADVSIIGKY